VLAGSEDRLEHARALHALGSAHRRAGRRADARDTLREALDLADRCGAAVLAAHVREELVAAGARPRRARLSGVEALTAQERRVAQMAADGLTNRLIAEALFLTTRTVEMHLANAYRKLGIASRAGLPNTFGRRGKDLG
jgi:DNA-binding CsgD family transcriptional regulator